MLPASETIFTRACVTDGDDSAYQYV